MEVISFRVPKELKKKMEEININWSEELREYIAWKIKKWKREEAIKNMEKIRNMHKKSDIKMSEMVIKSRKEH